MSNGFGSLRLGVFAGTLGAVLSVAATARAQSDAKPVETANAAKEQSKDFSTIDDQLARVGDVVLLTREYARVSRDTPKLVERAGVPSSSFVREWYRVEWRAQDPFYLYVIRPKGVAKPPVILYLPSFPDDTELFTNNKWCELAVRGGYATVGFVGNVTGHRTRYRLLKDWFVSEMPEALTSTTHDVQLILDYLTTRGDFDMDRVGMYGAGSGASIAILASVVDPRIKTLDLLAPWGDWKTWLSESKVVPDNERASYLKPEFLERVEPLDPVRWLPKIHAKALRIEDIRGNKAMPDKAQEQLEAVAPDFALINQYGNGRAFLNAQKPPAVLEWAKAQLAPDRKAQLAMEKSQRIRFIPPLEPPPSPVDGLIPSATAAKALEAGKEKPAEKQNPR